MEVVVIILLILLNGIFSMSEIALVSSRKYKLEIAAKKGNKNAVKALELSHSPNIFMSTVQIGITLIGILLGVFSGDKLTLELQLALENIPVFQPYAQNAAVVIVVIIITYLSIVFGELLPKRIGLTYPETVATIVARPMYVLSLAASPFVWLLTHTNDLFLKLFNIRSSLDSKVSEEEIKSIIQESAEGGEIQEIEQTIVERVFVLGDRKVDSLMTHRTDLAWLDVNDNLENIKRKMGEEIHSIYPVADGQIDNILGLVSIKELFVLKQDPSSFDFKSILRQPVFIHENAAAYKVLEIFKLQKTHQAMVIDEYGSIQGMITMDDMLDALVGDMSDDNQEEYSIFQRDENSWLADGQYSFHEFLLYFDLDYDEEKNYEFNTLGGFLLGKSNGIPKAGDTFFWQNLQLEIVDMDGRRIDKIMISKKEDTK